MKPEIIFIKPVFILALCLASITFRSYSQIITTIAGNGTGFGGDGGPATAALMNQSPHCVIDPAGNVYITDYNNNRIRKVDPSGIISTIAGTGVAGYSGDGGAATAAKLNHPNLITLDVAGNIYFGDEYNYVIRKISTTGVISRAAGNGTYGYSGDGGPATNAKLGNAVGVTVAPSGDLMIADYANQRVRMVNISSGIITTVAGTGIAGFTGDGGSATAARIYQPVCVTFDAAGNYYIVDQLNNRIRKVTPAGIITTVVGSGSTFGYSGDGNPATNAVLHYPAEAIFDSYGNLYIADSYNNVIRKVNTSGIISTFAGTGVYGFGGDGGPAISALFRQCAGITIDGVGNIYIGDFFNSRIRKIVFGNHPPSFTGGSSQTLTVCQNSGATPINSLLAVIDTDISQTETWNMYLAPVHGTAIANYVTTSTGTTLTPTGLSYTPTFGYTGTDSFKVSVTDGTGSDSITIYVTISPLPVVGLISGPTTLCAGSAVTLTDTSAGGTWTSSNTTVATVAASTGIVTGLSTGTTIISYAVTNACGTSVDTQMVTVIGLPSPGTITGPATLCPGTSATFIDPITGGAWASSNPAVAIVGATSGIVTGIATGTAIISYSVTNLCGTATDTQAIVVTLTPSAGTITGPTGVCAGATISLANATTGGTWTSSNPSIATVGFTTGIVGGITTGTVVITYTFTNACGTATDTQSITVNPAPFAGTITGPTNVCAGSTINLVNTTTGGAWSSSFVAFATVTSAGMVSGVAAGTSIISYSVTNACGTAVDTQAVTVNPLPSAGVISAASNSICNGTSFTLLNTQTGGTWTSSNTAIATIDPATGYLSALTLGTITITYTTAPSTFGCVNQTTFPLSVISPSSFNVTGTIYEIKCSGESNAGIAVVIPAGAGVGPYQFTWSNGSTSSSLTGLGEGNYTVTVKDMGTNCVDTQRFAIYMPSPIDVTPVIKNSYCKLDNGTITLGVTGGTTPYSFAWADGETTQDRINLMTASYSLVITDKNLCTKQLTVLVDEDSCSTIVIHDVITPNGDSKNDVWVIEGLYAYPNNTVQVFDKWGDAVFSTKNYSNDWEGNNPGGGMLPDGTYFYLLKLNADNVPGGKNTFTGSLLIKR